MTLACEGKFYPVHKLVLSTCSEYFENMFEQTPCKHPVVVLKDVKCDEVEALLSYMYAGVVSVAQNDLARLIKAAELLRIKGLAVPDEPPQPIENKRPPATLPWGSSRDDRTSPHPKKRRREDTATPHATDSRLSSSPSPRVSPYNKESEHVTDSTKTASVGHVSERSVEKNIDNAELRQDTRIEEKSEMNIEAPLTKQGSSHQVCIGSTSAFYI